MENPQSMKVGDLIRGTYSHDAFGRERAWLGIITDRDGDWLEITWEDGDIEGFDLGDMDHTQEIWDHWEVISENR